MPFKEDILQVVRTQGPIIPNQIKKILGGDTVLIGAILSEFVNQGLIKISNQKIGTSPTYYAAGQEKKLLNLKKYVNEKDRRTLELLQEKKILKDNEQEMLVRVGLRQIKDFAKQLEVNIKGEKILYWKWYLTTRTDAENLIRKDLNKWNTPVKEEIKANPITKEEITKKAPIEEKTISTAIKQEIKESLRQEREIRNQRQEKTENYEKPKQSVISKESIEGDNFSKQLHTFFQNKKIAVIEETIIRKNSEIELKLNIPSAVGDIEYFCKAKNKKRCNDGDLSSAYLKGQMTKLPVLFITTGEITKKAKQMLNLEFKGMSVKQI